MFPQGFYSNFLESAERYTDVLNSKSATYSLFNTLKEKFNGDTLQVSEIEIEIITQNDLDPQLFQMILQSALGLLGLMKFF